MDFAHIKTSNSPVTPFAWLDLDALRHNIDLVNDKLTAAERFRKSSPKLSTKSSTKSSPKPSIKLRLASKSIRSPDVMQYIKNKSPRYVGIMSYCAKESLYLLKQGFEDILCAYPTLDMDTVGETVKHGQAQPQIQMVWMVDLPKHLDMLNEVGEKYNAAIEVCIDINMSMPTPLVYFGTKRSKIKDINELKQLLHHLKSVPYINLVGIMGYEAQIAGLPEKLPQKPMLAPAIRALKSRSKKQVCRRRYKMVKMTNKWLKKQNKPALRLVNGGGSGSLDFTAVQPEVNEVTVGSAYYKPAYFDYMDSMDGFKPAAGFALRVTRQPQKDVITCHGGGFIASGAFGIDKSPVIEYPKGLQILSEEGFGEVQTPMQVLRAKQRKGKPMKLGDVVWCRHAKAGELCEHFNALICFQNNQKTNQVMTTYRGNGQCFH